MSTRLFSRLKKIERLDAEKKAARLRQHRFLMSELAQSMLADLPDLALVRPEDTDPETYRDIQETLAEARHDWAAVERLPPRRPDPEPPAHLKGEAAVLWDLNREVMEGAGFERAVAKARERAAQERAAKG